MSSLKKCLIFLFGQNVCGFIMFGKGERLCEKCVGEGI